MKHPFADAVRVLERHLPSALRYPEPWVLTNRDEVRLMVQVVVK